MNDPIHKFRVVENVTPRAMRIMDLYIAGLGPKEIADRLDMDRRTVGSLINAPNFQHTLAIRRQIKEDKQDDEAIQADDEAAKVLKEHAKEAAERMIGLMQNESPGISLRATADILDRVGPSKQKQANINQQAVVVIGDEAARLINETLTLDMGEINGTIVTGHSVHPRGSGECSNNDKRIDDRENDEMAY